MEPAKGKKVTTVSRYIQQLEAPLAEMVEALRQIIRGSDPQIAEHIKWNSPAFYYTGNMKAFDAKDYKRDIVVINLHRGHPLLVFPTGAKLQANHALSSLDYKDGRRVVTFTSIDEIREKETELANLVSEWMSMVEK